GRPQRCGAAADGDGAHPRRLGGGDAVRAAGVERRALQRLPAVRRAGGLADRAGAAGHSHAVRKPAQSIAARGAGHIGVARRLLGRGGGRADRAGDLVGRRAGAGGGAAGQFLPGGRGLSVRRGVGKRRQLRAAGGGDAHRLRYRLPLARGLDRGGRRAGAGAQPRAARQHDGQRLFCDRPAMSRRWLRWALLAFGFAGVLGCALFLIKANERSFAVEAVTRGLKVEVEHTAMSSWLLDAAVVCFRRERRLGGGASAAGSAHCDPTLYETVALANLELAWPSGAVVALNRSGPDSPLVVRLETAGTALVDIEGRPLT